MAFKPTSSIDKLAKAAWQPAFWQRHPGFASVASAAGALCQWSAWPDMSDYYRQLSMPSVPVRFVGADVASYEDHIAQTNEVPTRYASWHDLFNALIWHGFPLSKFALNRVHRSAKQQAFSAGQRGRRRDAATLFDESGAVIWSDDANLLELIREMDWPQLFLAHRESFGSSLGVLLFGHGLLEQLRSPFLGLTAHALLLHLPTAKAKPITASALVSTPTDVPTPGVSETDSRPFEYFAHGVPPVLDERLAQEIEQHAVSWTPADLAPFPFLGIPGWWPGNDQPAFYENRRYFRRERHRQQPRQEAIKPS